jgi:hypothetical protein
LTHPKFSYKETIITFSYVGCKLMSLDAMKLCYLKAKNARQRLKSKNIFKPQIMRTKFKFSYPIRTSIMMTTSTQSDNHLTCQCCFLSLNLLWLMKVEWFFRTTLCWIKATTFQKILKLVFCHKCKPLILQSFTT